MKTTKPLKAPTSKRQIAILTLMAGGNCLRLRRNPESEEPAVVAGQKFPPGAVRALHRRGYVGYRGRPGFDHDTFTITKTGLTVVGGL